MTTLMRRHAVVTFFVLAYVGSWVLWSPMWLSRNGIGLVPLDLSMAAIAGVNQLGLFGGPFAAALIMTHLTEGRGSVRRFLARLVTWRAHPWWYVMAIVIVPFAVFVGYAATLFGSLTAGPEAVVTLAVMYPVYLLGGPVQEETGWRGFALPRLQARMHPLAAAVLLGVVHCFWHAPLFLTRDWDTARGDVGELVAYLLLVVSLSVVLSCIVNGSHGSLLLAVLGHNGVNWALLAVATFSGTAVESNWPAALGLATLALVAGVATRGRLAAGSSTRPVPMLPNSVDPASD